jgi:hypothetical protein
MQQAVGRTGEATSATYVTDASRTGRYRTARWRKSLRSSALQCYTYPLPGQPMPHAVSSERGPYRP